MTVTPAQSWTLRLVVALTDEQIAALAGTSPEPPLRSSLARQAARVTEQGVKIRMPLRGQDSRAADIVGTIRPAARPPVASDCSG
jgi:hypothetical protein